MKTKEIAVQQPTQAPDMMSLLQLAISKESAIDVIERLAAMQREARDYQAIEDFNNAMHRCQSQMKRISADCYNPQTKSKYSSYAQLDRALRPIYTREGFSLSFNGADCPLAEHERVICYVSRHGHTRTYQGDIPNDGKGAKGGDVMTKTHASGAAKSYGMRYLLKMIFNVAVGEDDNDGNVLELSKSDRDAMFAAIATAATIDDLKSAYLSAVRQAKMANDSPLSTELEAAKDVRKGELTNAS